MATGDARRGAGRPREPEDVVPFGGEQAHKAFALAVGLEALVGALAGEEPGAVLLVARPEHDAVGWLRARAPGVRLPGRRRRPEGHVRGQTPRHGRSSRGVTHESPGFKPHVLTEGVAERNMRGV